MGTSVEQSSSDKPIVWAVCIGVWPHGDQSWAAFSNDGQTITGHVSSNRDWGIHDVGPKPWHAEKYERVVGTSDPARIDYRVVPHGEFLPDDVVERGIAAGHMKRRHDSEKSS